MRPFAQSALVDEDDGAPLAERFFLICGHRYCFQCRMACLVSSAGPYEGRNLAEFWASGPKIWNDLKSASGYVPKSTDTVVEIGCGVGRLTRAIASEVGEVTVSICGGDAGHRAQLG